MHVDQLISENPRITYCELQDALHCGSAVINTILHNYLKVSKRLRQWVPHILTTAQKQARVDWCRKMLVDYDEGRSKRVYDIFTSDETWVYQFDPDIRSLNRECRETNDCSLLQKGWLGEHRTTGETCYSNCALVRDSLPPSSSS